MSITLEYCQKVCIQANMVNSCGVSVPLQSAIWNSNSTSIATVTSGGIIGNTAYAIVYALATGNTTIQCTMTPTVSYGGSPQSSNFHVVVSSNTTGCGTYPITQTVKLIGTGGIGAQDQGSSVSISGDGLTIAVGAPQNNGGVGATWIFFYNGTNWVQQAELIGTGNTGSSLQGTSVSLSSDGNTLAVGAPGNNSNRGGAWIFVRSGSSWSQQASDLVGTPTGASDQRGTSVSLSGDGNTLAVGGPNHSTSGGVWIWTRSGTTWSQQGSVLTGTGSVGASLQGKSVSLSSTTGNYLVIGGPGDNTNVGAVWVFNRSGTTWTQQGTKITGSGQSSSAGLGTSVSIDAAGDTIASGGPNDGSGVGAVWIFTRSGVTWSQQGSKLVSGDHSGNSLQGTSVSLSGNGSTLVFGGPGDNGLVGAMWLYVLSGTSWIQYAPKLVGTSAIGSAKQGTSISLDTNANRFVEGGLVDNTNVGASWVFG